MHYLTTMSDVKVSFTVIPTSLRIKSVNNYLISSDTDQVTASNKHVETLVNI